MNLNRIATLTIKSKTEGTQQTAKSLQDISRSQEAIAESGKKAASATVSLQQANDRNRRSMEMMAQQQMRQEMLDRERIASLEGQVEVLRELAAANDNVAQSNEKVNRGFFGTAREVVSLTENVRMFHRILIFMLPAFQKLLGPQIAGAIEKIATSFGLISPAANTASGFIVSKLLPALGLFARVFIAVQAVLTVFRASIALTELGAQKIQEFGEASDRAAKMGLTVDTLTRSEEAAKRLGLAVGTITDAMQKFNQVSDSGELSRKLTELQSLGNFFNNAGAASFAAANSNEERFRAIVQLITEAMEKGQRLAALDLAATFAPPEIMERLRASGDALKVMQDTADRIQQSKLIPTEELAKALELRRRMEDAQKIISDRWLPVQRDLTAAGLRFQESMVEINELMAKGVVHAQGIYEWFRQLPSLLREIGDSDFFKRIRDRFQSVLPTALPAGEGTTAGEQDEVRQRLASQLLQPAFMQRQAQQAAEIITAVLGDASVKTSDQYQKEFDSAFKSIVSSAGEAGKSMLQQLRLAELQAQLAAAANAIANMFNAGQIDRETAVKQTDQLIAAFKMAKTEIFAVKSAGINAYDSLIQRTKDQIELLKAEAELQGTNTDALVKMKFIQDAERAAAKSGVSANREQLEILGEELALRTKIAREAQKQRQFQADVAKSLASGVAGFISDMARGVELSEALANNLRKVSDALMEAATQRIADQLEESISAAVGAIAGAAGGPIASAAATMAVAVAIAVISDLVKGNSEELKQAAENTKKFKDALLDLNKTISGEILGTIEKQAKAFTDQANKIAEEAQKQAEQIAAQNTSIIDTILDDWFGVDPEPVQNFKAMTDFTNTMNEINAFIERESKKFRDTFGASIESLTSGLGLSTVAEEIVRLGDALKAFIKDTQTAFGGDLSKVQQATKASQDMLLSIIGGVPAMSDFEKEMLRISQAADAVKAVLIDLGMTADQATAAVDAQAASARAMAQAAEDARIATERMNLELRLMRATTDSNSLAGALAIQQLEQQIEMQEAIASNSQNLVLLQQIHDAERLALIKGFYDREIEEQERANQAKLDAERRRREEEERILEEAQRTLDNFSRSIEQFIHNTLTGSQSPLSPQARLTTAQSSFQQQLNVIATGTPQQVREAMNSITGFAQDVLDASRDVFGSGTQGQQIFQEVISTLEALPDQISVQELILEAIEDQTTTIIDQDAITRTRIDLMRTTLTDVLNTGDLDSIRATLLTWLPQIDLNTDGLITFDEMQAALGDTYPDGTLRGIFDNLDGNGNGVLEKSELIRQNTLNTDLGIDQSNSLLNSINALQNTANAQLSLLQQQTDIGGGVNVPIPGVGNVQLFNNILTALNKIVVNTYIIAGNTVNPGNTSGHFTGIFAQGGFVSGGIANRDSVPVLAMPGEYILRKSVAQANARELPQFNATGRWPGAANDDLIDEVRALQRAVIYVASRVDNAADRNVGGQKRLAEETRQQIRRPTGHGGRNKAA